jgi:hypothetical protein
MARIRVTDNARRYRRLMWLVALAGVPALFLAVRGIQGRVPVWLGLAGGIVFILAIVIAAVLGLKMHRQTIADREMHARRALIVMMAASLGEQSDEQLKRIETQGGISGEAAGMILRNRRAEPDE